MDEQRTFIKADNHQTVNTGDLEESSVALFVIEPKFNKEERPEATVREGAEELTL